MFDSASDDGMHRTWMFVNWVGAGLNVPSRQCSVTMMPTKPRFASPAEQHDGYYTASYLYCTAVGEGAISSNAIFVGDVASNCGFVGMKCRRHRADERHRMVSFMSLY